MNQACRNRGTGGAADPPDFYQILSTLRFLQIFDLLRVDSDIEKKKVAETKKQKHFKFIEKCWYHYSCSLHVTHKANFD